MPVIKHHLKPGDGENPLQATADEGRFDAERYLAFSDALRGLHRRIRQETDGFLGREADAVFDAGGSWEAHLDRGLPHNLWQMLLAPQATPEQRARLFSNPDRILVEASGDDLALRPPAGEPFHDMSLPLRTTMGSKSLHNYWIASQLGIEPTAIEETLRGASFEPSCHDVADLDPESNWDWVDPALLDQLSIGTALAGAIDAVVAAADAAEAKITERIEAPPLVFGSQHQRAPWTAILFEMADERSNPGRARTLLEWLSRSRRVELDAVPHPPWPMSHLELVDRAPDGVITRGQIFFDGVGIRIEAGRALLGWCLFELGVDAEALNRLRESFPDSPTDDVHPDLLDPHYFDTSPDDEGAGELPGEEWHWRDRHRRESFRRCLGELSGSFEMVLDEHDWSTDEASEGCDIPLVQLQDATERIEAMGFTYVADPEPNDYSAAELDDEEELVKLWVIDPVVNALIPDDYNCYTLRAPEEES